MIWTVPRSWEGETIFIVAGGPSLRRVHALDLSRLHAHGRVLAVNDAWRLAPKCDALYFTDAKFYEVSLQKDPWATESVINFGQFLYKGLLISGAENGYFIHHPQVRQLTITRATGLDRNPSRLCHGHNSGYAAINLAYHFGARRIVLLGYDMHVEHDRTHWHEEDRPNGFAQVLQSVLPNFETLVLPLQNAGVEVLNANPESSLKCWPFVKLEDILDPDNSDRQENAKDAR